MPRLPKKRRAAIIREKLKKLHRNLEDPLAWTFEDPWNSVDLRTTVSIPPTIPDINQPVPSTSGTDSVQTSVENAVYRSVPESWDITDTEPPSKEQSQPNEDMTAVFNVLPCPSDANLAEIQIPDMPDLDAAMDARQDACHVRSPHAPLERSDDRFSFTDTEEQNTNGLHQKSANSARTVGVMSSFATDSGPTSEFSATGPAFLHSSCTSDDIKGLDATADCRQGAHYVSPPCAPLEQSDDYYSAECISTVELASTDTDPLCQVTENVAQTVKSSTVDSSATPSSPIDVHHSATPVRSHFSYTSENVKGSSLGTSESLATKELQDTNAKNRISTHVPMHRPEYKSIRLSRSKTTIIEIPGLRAGQTIDLSLDCFCTACVKWATYQSSAQPYVAPGTSDVVPEVEEMDRVYRSFDSLKAKKRFFKRARFFVPKDNRKLKLAKRTVRKRLQAIDADEYTKVEIFQGERIQGRRIVEYDYFIKWLTMAQAVHSQKCKGILCSYQEEFKSMVSTLYLKCNVCSEIVRGYSEKPSSKNRLRLCIVWAILCSGGTFTLAEEIFSFLNMPFISKSSYIKDETAMDGVIEGALEESMNNAIEAEKTAVRTELEQKGIEQNEQDLVKSSGALDGSWGQRSNGHRYNSASGCAAIIGTRSKKVCFVGCRNKRCFACNLNVRRAKNRMEIRKHKCYRNYKGASGGMEPDIIIDGFKKLHNKGLKFSTVITDGDSTTVSRLKNNCKYGSEIRHQLCCNHAMKGLGKKLREIKCPKQFADTVSNSIERITRGIRSAIKYCADETNGEDTEGLRHDIRNAPFHAFGSHENCRPYFCKNKEDVTEYRSIIPDLQCSGIWDKIMLAVEKTAAKAESLSENRTSNVVENLYCRLSKYNVGKRVDTMSRGSYQRRVYVTVLQHNEGYQWHDKHMYQYTGEHPGYWLRQMFQRKTASFLYTKKMQGSPGFVRRKPVPYDEIERDYGVDAVEAFEQEMNVPFDLSSTKKKYELSESAKQLLQTDLTMAQMEEFAFGRILSKYVPEIISSRETTKHKKCDSILQTSNTWNYLKSNRSVVGLILRSLKDRHSVVMGGNRMYVDSCHNYLCCVPDAVSEDGSTVLLIKKDLRNVKKKAASKSTTKKQTVDKNTFIEAQTVMHICDASKCLVVYINSSNYSDYKLHEIDCEEDFFQTRISGKLAEFFENFILKKVSANAFDVKV